MSANMITCIYNHGGLGGSETYLFLSISEFIHAVEFEFSGN